jgi:hypothetical protein
VYARMVAANVVLQWRETFGKLDYSSHHVPLLHAPRTSDKNRITKKLFKPGVTDEQILSGLSPVLQRLCTTDVIGLDTLEVKQTKIQK